MTIKPFAHLFYRTTILLLCCLLSAAAVCAQSTTGSISGSVKDANGAVVPAAAVNVNNPATGIALSAETNGDGEFTLEIGGATETVTVTANSAELQLKTESGERSDLIESRQIRDLALNGRNLFDLFKVVPGVTNVSQGNQVSQTTGLDSFSIN